MAVYYFVVCFPSIRVGLSVRKMDGNQGTATCNEGYEARSQATRVMEGYILSKQSREDDADLEYDLSGEHGRIST